VKVDIVCVQYYSLVWIIIDFLWRKRNVLFCHCIFRTSVTFTPAVFPLLSVCNVLIVPRTCSTSSVFSFLYYYRYNCTSDVTPCSLVGSYRCFEASYCTTVIPLNTFVRKLCVVYHDTWRHYMEDSNVHWHYPENLEFYVSDRCKISGRITVLSVLIFTAWNRKLGSKFWREGECIA
jgi:hypothetical protein